MDEVASIQVAKAINFEFAKVASDQVIETTKPKFQRKLTKVCGSNKFFMKPTQEDKLKWKSREELMNSKLKITLMLCQV